MCFNSITEVFPQEKKTPGVLWFWPQHIWGFSSYISAFSYYKYSSNTLIIRQFRDFIFALKCCSFQSRWTDSFWLIHIVRKICMIPCLCFSTFSLPFLHVFPTCKVMPSRGVICMFLSIATTKHRTTLHEFVFYVCMAQDSLLTLVKHEGLRHRKAKCFL